ncbi:hypothetical protein ASE00_02175 [Sphingomonas sp. Root710]|nr:hypothetical protein ASE00_02175 [Sphingomonas sp. Root710]
MRRIVVLALAALLCIGIAVVANYSKQQPGSNMVETPATAATPLPKQPTAFGINVFGPIYWSRERAFMNLVAGAGWYSILNGWSDLDLKRLDREGALPSLRPGENVAVVLVRPPRSVREDVAIRCRYEGEGVVSGISTANPVASPGRFDFTWHRETEWTHLRIEATNPANPIRHIDCREADADPKLLFDPAFVASVKPYKVVRFMDWQQSNSNAAGNWAQRTLPSSTFQAGGQGVALEHMVALANIAQVDPWFVIPWNADAVYVENFARYVHDHLDPKRAVYLETGNEIWNQAFPAGQQALAEGRKANLGKTDDQARMRRYAQRSVEVFKIWERVYAQEPKRLVRILSGQHAWIDPLRDALAFGDTAAHVDALSSAAYFGQTLLTEPEPADTKDLSPLFPKLTASIDATMEAARQYKQLADQHGLRYIVYEGGQHATYSGKDPTLLARLNRDPRMGEAYRRYLAEWDSQYGDVLMLFHSTSPIGATMAFGLAEYSGQPLAETPKRKAVLDAIAAVSRSPR